MYRLIIIGELLFLILLTVILNRVFQSHLHPFTIIAVYYALDWANFRADMKQTMREMNKSKVYMSE